VGVTTGNMRDLLLTRSFICIGDPLASAEGKGKPGRCKCQGYTRKAEQGQGNFAFQFLSRVPLPSRPVARCCSVLSLPFSLETFATKVKITLVRCA